jgi:hypothetical protein
MSAAADLERRYRRSLAWYPRSFRTAYEQEMLTVLMETARDGQRRPQVGQTADLARNALLMRLRPGAPRSAPAVFAAVRLMYLGAVVEVMTVLTVLLTTGMLRSEILTADPGFTAAQWQAFLWTSIAPLVAGGTIAVAVWLWMAWANGRAHRWGRAVFTAFFAITTLSLLNGISQGAATYSVPDLVAGIALWLVALTAVALLYTPSSSRYYRTARSR